MQDYRTKFTYMILHVALKNIAVMRYFDFLKILYNNIAKKSGTFAD